MELEIRVALLHVPRYPTDYVIQRPLENSGKMSLQLPLNQMKGAGVVKKTKQGKG
jgi:hypothetical protein